MTAPVIVLRVDWENTGAFNNTPMDTVHPMSLHLTRGTSADFSADAIDQLTFTLENSDDAYTPDRNWHDNPSFEVDTGGWSVAPSGFTLAGTSISRVADNATSATGSWAGEAVLPAAVNAGTYYALPYTFRSGVTYPYSVYLKSMSGSTAVQVGVGSVGTIADVSTAIPSTITSSWVAYSGTWTPSGARTDAALFVRATASSAATVRIDGIQLNAGSAINTYVESPTRGMLTAGRPVHLSAVYSAASTAKFYGFIERITPNPETRIVDVVCEGVLGRMSETDIHVSATALTRTARDYRIAILEDYERGNRNLVGHNPTFATDTSSWSRSGAGGSLTRVTTDAPALSGVTTSADWVAGTTGLLSIFGRLAPVAYFGQTYRASIYMRTTSGTASVTLGIGWTGALAYLNSRTVTVTTAWQRFTVTGTLDTNLLGSSTTPLTLQLAATGVTVRVAAASITRGQALYPYSNLGTGRWANMVGNGSFDGQTGQPAGWYHAFTNICTNGSFESSTTGWSVAADAFHAAGTSITRTVAASPFGVAYGRIVTAGIQGAHFALTGTFTAGVTYGIGVTAKNAGGGNCTFGIGSQGTPTDLATTTPNLTTGFVAYTFTWTPTGTRTDAHFYVKTSGADTVDIDGAYVFQRDAAASSVPTYVDTGPGGGGLAGSQASAVNTSNHKWGIASLQVTANSSANMGIVYDFNQVGAYFVSGQQYSISVWVTGIGAYKIGIAADIGDGTYDEASTTGTSSGWTNVTFTWTPSADRSAASAWTVLLYAYHTAASGVTFYLDGIRVIPGGTADDFEMTQWSLAAGAESTDTYLTTATITGTAAQALAQLNDLTLTRHWIVPSMTTPWFTYTTEDRDTFAADTSSETFSDSVQVFDGIEIDRAAKVNVVGITYPNHTEYYSDDVYDPRPAPGISGSAFFADRTLPDLIGPAKVTRYKRSRMRPRMTNENQWPSQLQRELNDIVVVSISRYLIYKSAFVILSEDLTIDQAGQHWLTVYQLEEFPYG